MILDVTLRFFFRRYWNVLLLPSSNPPLFEPSQSGFCSQHSIEIALLKVKDNTPLSTDSGLFNILTLLNLTAAFDTNNQSILLSYLESHLAITSSAPSWLQSYLSNNNCLSSTFPLDQGIPQGSVHAPLLLILYILLLGNIIRKHGLQFHRYTDNW